MTDDEINTMIEDVLDSMDLAMQSEGIAESSRSAILTTVSDYIGNHYGED